MIRGTLRLLSAVVIAVRAVRRNTLRAALTILGITIGVAAVVTMTALGGGARDSVGGSISNLGTNALIVFPQSARASGLRGAGSVGSRLSELDCDALVRESTSIRAVAPFLTAAGQVYYEANNAKPTIIGTRLAYFEIRNWKITKGALWPTGAEAVSDRVVVLGSQTARDLLGSLDPVGRIIRIGRHTYEVLGVLEEKGASPLGQNQDEVVIMPITTMRSHVLFTRPHDTHGLMVAASSAETTDRAKVQTEAILRQRHHVKDDDEDDFVVRSQAEFKALQGAVFGALTALLVSIAAISLVVGGIGVMNIMLVSVAERTR